MTAEQIKAVADAARTAAIHEANKHGDRCAFAIVVCGLDVGSSMTVRSNVKGDTAEGVIRILQNGVQALRNKGGGLILLSSLALLIGALLVGAGCGSVEANDATDVARGGAAGEQTPGTGGAGGAAAAGVAGGGAAGDTGTGGVAGGAGASGGAAADGGAGLDAGLTGAAGAGGSCAPRGAICYQCPAPAPTCAVANHGAWSCCDQVGAPTCDPTWCRQ